MMNSFPSYLIIKSYYDKGYWDRDRVMKAVELNRITTKQYETITGSEYPNNNLKTPVKTTDVPEFMQSSPPAKSDSADPDSSTAEILKEKEGN